MNLDYEFESKVDFFFLVRKLQPTNLSLLSKVVLGLFYHAVIYLVRAVYIFQVDFEI